jgi:hypothetical protein
MTDDNQGYEMIDYTTMIDEAMRSVVKQSLELAIELGAMPGEHHFFISFDTNHKHTKISPAIKQRFPDEMTIVLQHQYWDLEVHDKFFSVMLSFNNVPEKLVVPYAALTAFADPSVKFGLQFHSSNFDDGFDEDILAEIEADTSFEMLMPTKSDNEDNDGSEPASAEVISLDAFRKK